MKIRTKLIMNVLVSLALLLTVGITLHWSKQKINRSMEMDKKANEIMRHVFELNITIDQYLLYSEERPKVQFLSICDSVKRSLAMMKVESSEEQDLIRRMHQDHEEMGSLFKLLVSILDGKNMARENTLTVELRERVVGQLLARSREIVSAAFQISKIADERAAAVQQRGIFSVVIAILISGMLMAVISYLINQSILRPIKKLEEGAKSISRGSLDYQIDIERHDEIGRLSKAFNEMTNKLKRSYASIEDLKRMEETLRQSEVKYRTVVNNTYDWEFWIKPGGEFLYCSPSCKRLTGHSGEEFMQNRSLLRSVVYPEDLVIFDRHRQEEEEEEVTPAELQFRISHTDGSLRWIGHVCQRVFDEEGRFLGIRGNNRDITKRKEMEKELTRLASFPELNPNPIAEIDLAGNIYYLNPATKELFPDLQTAGPKHLWLADFESLVSKFRQESKTSYTRGVKIGSRWHQQSIHCTAGDRIRIYGLDITPQKKMEEELRKSHDELEIRVQKRTSELERMNEQLQAEINVRKRAEEAVKAERQRLNDVLEMLPAYLVLLSPDYHVPFANRFFRERFGDSHGRRCFEYLFGRSEPCEICETYTVMKTKASHHWQWTGPDGRIYDVYDYPFTDTDGSPLIMEMGIDITERKEAQKRIEATNTLPSLFVRMRTRKDYLDGVLELVQNWCGCRCAGIRVLDGQGNIPYDSFTGFSREFWESENFLSVRNDHCVCIRVITGEMDPQDIPIMTPGGSFCCGHTIKFICQLSEKEKKRYRGVCVENGFLSVAVIPICYGERILGAIHLADETENRVTFKSLEFIESIAPLIGEAIYRFNVEEELRESEGRLRHLSNQLLTVQENERKRISQEIHDSIGQTLSAIKFGLESKLNQIGKGSAPRGVSLESIISLAQNGIEESRRIQMDLRPSILDDLGIISTLNWFSRVLQQTYSAIHIDKEIDIVENEVPETLKTVIYRISQEAMNNMAKHSKASLVSLSLKKKEGTIELTIQDNGSGFDLDATLSAENYKGGLGLTSMRERAELSGGSFAIESTIGKGTTIRAKWLL